MEKVFVHPECPFSVNTFNLLAEFKENPTSHFYLAHKKDFLKYVEEPLKYILSQVEEQLPDFIKEYINIKHEGFASITEIGDWEPTAYSIVFYLKNIISTVLYISRAQLMLNLENQKLTFGFSSESNNFEAVEEYRLQHYIIDGDIIELLKRYQLPKTYSFCLTQETTDFKLHNWDFNSTIELAKNVYELLEKIFTRSRGVIPYEVNIEVTKIQFQISLESQKILGYSANDLIRKIGQTFKKLFPLFLIFNFYDYNNNYLTQIILSEYLSVYEKEFNPVYQLEKISEITGFQTTQLTQWIHAINRKGQTIIQGPPGTGKTFLAHKLAQHLIGGGDGFSDTIQFHPAYTYEDFIQGIRPQSQDRQLTYPIVPGRFLEFCEKAEACEDICVLIIDEINRANLSQVFGELMYLLDDRQDTKRFITLASGQKFRIPTNVRIIGTMNTADRSIALVDNALRRRFAFIPIYPNYEVLRQYHQREETGFPVNKLTRILEDVNRAINNKHYELGISFFLTKTLAEDIQDIWQMEIEPYLEEYFFDNQAKMDEFLWDNIKTKLGY
ncbi:AAA family ATPase [Microcoleus sp. Pol11C3]|uniref:AAA family ATPase n=1 Tax=Microcoleus sp. Pol11C3 TaxID=3055390 RepID=UPI002FCF1C5A